MELQARECSVELCRVWSCAESAVDLRGARARPSSPHAMPFPSDSAVSLRGRSRTLRKLLAGTDLKCTEVEVSSVTARESSRTRGEANDITIEILPEDFVSGVVAMNSSAAASTAVSMTIANLVGTGTEDEEMLSVECEALGWAGCELGVLANSTGNSSAAWVKGVGVWRQVEGTLSFVVLQPLPAGTLLTLTVRLQNQAAAQQPQRPRVSICGGDDVEASQSILGASVVGSRELESGAVDLRVWDGEAVSVIGNLSVGNAAGVTAELRWEGQGGPLEELGAVAVEWQLVGALQGLVEVRVPEGSVAEVELWLEVDNAKVRRAGGCWGGQEEGYEVCTPGRVELLERGWRPEEGAPWREAESTRRSNIVSWESGASASAGQIGVVKASVVGSRMLVVMSGPQCCSSEGKPCAFRTCLDPSLVAVGQHSAGGRRSLLQAEYDTIRFYNFNSHAFLGGGRGGRGRIRFPRIVNTTRPLLRSKTDLAEYLAPNQSSNQNKSSNGTSNPRGRWTKICMSGRAVGGR